MDHFLTYFNKSIDSITIDDIITFFKDEHSESNRIEFKSYKPGGNINEKIKPIISSICAFLNSEGGVIIWGAPQGIIPPNKKEKVFIGTPSYVNEHIENDKLINKICDCISPLPTGITARVIGGKDNFIYLFNIQASLIKPHQFDNKYMIRLDGQSRVAPHYYIEAMFRQIKYPDIEGYIKFSDIQIVKEGLELTIETIIFNWSPLQNEKNVIILVFSPHGLFINSRNRLNLINKYHEYGVGGHQSLTRKLDDILFFGSPFHDSDNLLFNISDIKNVKEFEIILRFGGENSPPKESYYKICFKIDEVDKPVVEIIESFENKLISEIRAETGLNKNEVIKNIIGR